MIIGAYIVADANGTPVHGFNRRITLYPTDAAAKASLDFWIGTYGNGVEVRSVELRIRQEATETQRTQRK